MKTAQIACVLACLLCCRYATAGEQGQVEVEGPTVSPDGKSVVFSVVYRKSDGVLATGPVVALDLRTGLTKEILLPTHTVTRESPIGQLEFRAPRAEAWYGFSWSPDCSAVFSTVSMDEGFTIWKLPLQGDKPEMICGFPVGLRQRPRVSPDGKWVIFYDATSRNLFRI